MRTITHKHPIYNKIPSAKCIHTSSWSSAAHQIERVLAVFVRTSAVAAANAEGALARDVATSDELHPGEKNSVSSRSIQTGIGLGVEAAGPSSAPVLRSMRVQGQPTRYNQHRAHGVRQLTSPPS